MLDEWQARQVTLQVSSSGHNAKKKMCVCASEVSVSVCMDVNIPFKLGLCAYVTFEHDFATKPSCSHLCIVLGGKIKWLPMNTSRGTG